MPDQQTPTTCVKASDENVHRGSLTAAYQQGFAAAREGAIFRPVGTTEHARWLYRNGFEDGLR